MKLMPHNIEAERAVLGSCLADNSLVDTVIAEVIVPWFYAPKHQELYRGIIKLHEQNEIIDIITLGDATNINHTPYIAELIDGTIGVTGLKKYIQILKDTELKRRIIKNFTTLIDLAYDPDSQIEELVPTIQKTAIDLVYNKETRLRHIKASLNDACGQIERAYNGEVVGLPTGFDQLDKHTGGFKGGRLYILGARPSVGKSAFAKCITENMARQGNAVLFFSVEMGDSEHAKRHISAASMVPLWKLDTGKIHLPEWDVITTAIGELSELPIWYDDSPYQKVSQIISTTRRMKIEQNIKLVVVDYIQLLHGEGDIKKREEIVAAISRGLKLMAKDLDVAVLGLAQLNRETEKANTKPQLSNLRESGGIEQDADVVMFLHDEDPKDDSLEIIIAKNRQGKKGFVKLIWQKDTVNYSEEV